MRVLVLGGGYAAQRYVESLIWSDNDICIVGFGAKKKSKELSTKFGLRYISYRNLNKSIMNYFDIVVICVPVHVKFDIIQKILIDLEYKNCLIIEKPLTLRVNELEGYRELLGKIDQCAIVCQRDFEIHNYSIEKANSYSVTWYSISDDFLYNIQNMLPHLLSWLMLELGTKIKVKIKEKKICGTINEKSICISFKKHKENKVVINNKVYNNPNYRRTNSMIVQAVMQYDRDQTNQNVCRAINVSKIICGLMEEI